jgi:membrane associated rhomboid family serine protease
MTPTAVGMRCPECSRSKTKVRTLRSMAVEPTATYVLIALNVVMFVAEQVGRGSGVNEVILRLATLGIGPDTHGHAIGVAQGEYWRLLTGGFLHDVTNPLHIGFNMYILWWLGRMLEPSLGHVRFVALYVASLLAGSFGAILVEPTTPTIGASGAVFGLMGAAFLMQRARGIDPFKSGLGMLIIANLVLQFLIPGVSWGAHVGGLIGGGIAGWAMDRVSTRFRAGLLAPLAVCAVVGAIAVVGAVVVSDSKAAEVLVSMVG